MLLGKAAITCTCYSHFSCYAFSPVILVPFSGPCEIILKWKPQMVQFNIAPQLLCSWMFTLVYFFFFFFPAVSKSQHTQVASSCSEGFEMMAMRSWKGRAGRKIKGEEGMVLGKAVGYRLFPEYTCRYSKECHSCQYFTVVVFLKLHKLNIIFSCSTLLKELWLSIE